MRKKILLSLSLSVITISLINAQTSFGVRAGVNFQNLTGKDYSGASLNNSLLTGFHIGANVETGISKDFYFQPGLLYTVKGAKSNDGNTKITINYIELPFNFLYKPQLGSGKLITGAGLYAAFGISGKEKSPSGTSKINFKSKVDVLAGGANNEVVFLRGLDYGFNIFAGYELSNRLSLQLNAQLGLMNINPTDERVVNDRSDIKNTGFGISLSYRFKSISQ